MEKTVFNVKVSEQCFDHSNKDHGGYTNMNWCRTLLHYSLCTAEWKDGKMKESSGMRQTCQTFNESTIIFWKHFENTAVYAKGEPHEKCQETSGSCIYSKFKRKGEKPISMKIAFYIELRQYFHDSWEHLYFIINTAKKIELLKSGTILISIYNLKLIHFLVMVENR